MDMEEFKMTTDTIAYLPLDLLHPCPAHPVKLRDDNAMRELIESVRTRGIIHPIIVRPAEYGYEIIDGRRRVKACTVAGMETVPAIVRELDDDQAIIDLIDSCIQREEILPSERAAAYRLKLEAIKRQGARHDLTSRQVVGKLEAADIVGAETGESGRQVQRIIRLTELVPDLQQMVDDGRIAMTPAVELSYLKPEEQSMLVETIDCEQATPSLSQAQRMKKLSQDGILSDDIILEILCEVKKPAWDRITLKGNKLRQYFPANYTPLQIETTIYRILEAWQKQKKNAKKDA
ncbi:MAG: ParB/RepB/Spo0J family partition protein [Clostridia bacterium]|nr:ParB/RepB/Spo0J family partition protein [Clostridia bacterium]